MCFNLNLFNSCLFASSNNNSEKNNNKKATANVKSNNATSSGQDEKVIIKSAFILISDHSTTTTTVAPKADCTKKQIQTNLEYSFDPINAHKKTKFLASELASTLLDNHYACGEEDVKETSKRSAKKNNPTSHNSTGKKYLVNYWNCSNQSYSDLNNITIDDILNTKDKTNLLNATELDNSSPSSFSSLSPSLSSRSTSFRNNNKHISYYFTANSSNTALKSNKMNTPTESSTAATHLTRPQFEIPFGKNSLFLNNSTNANNFTPSPVSGSRPIISLGNSSLAGLQRPIININSSAGADLKIGNLKNKKHVYTFQDDNLLPKTNEPDDELSTILDENLTNLRLDGSGSVSFNNNNSSNSNNSNTKMIYEKKPQPGKHSHHHHHDKPKSKGGKIKISPNQVMNVFFLFCIFLYTHF